MNLIWATRGRTWGFRFISDGGQGDPLVIYDQVFAAADDDHELCRRVGGKLALRFSDPAGRRDRSGRVISHDFVVFGPLAKEIRSVEDGLKTVWPLVAEEYARIWALPSPPTRNG